MLRFNLKFLLALAALIGLLAALFAESVRQAGVLEEIAVAESWLAKFDHESIESLPWYRESLEYEDPIIEFRNQLSVAVVARQSQLELIPRRSDIAITVIEVPTMKFNERRFAVHVPEGSEGVMTIYAASGLAESIESLEPMSGTVFEDPIKLRLATGVSRVELVNDYVDRAAKLQDGSLIGDPASFVKLRINGEQLLDAEVGKFFGFELNGRFDRNEKTPFFLNGDRDDVKFPVFNFIESRRPVSGGVSPLDSFLLVVEFAKTLGSTGEGNFEGK